MSVEKSDDGSIRVVEVPPQPALIPCECEIDPWLAWVESRDPKADASAAIAHGNFVLFAEPVLGGLAPVGVEPSLEPAETGFEVRVIPGVSENPDCFESARLTVVALEYARIYNKELLSRSSNDSER